MELDDHGGQQTETATPQTPASEPAQANAPQSATMPQRELLFGALLAGGVLVATLGVLMAGDARPDTAAADASPAPPSPARAAGAASADAPTWSDENRAMWIGNRKKGVAYDVAAENEIGVWMRTVRPTLVVRCVAGETDVFILTESAIQMDANTDDHTVTFSLDDGAETKELWPDSSTHDALFAPDGAAFARRLMAARTLRFGFTPHNAQPAVVRFHVTGLEPLLAPAAAECGWKK